MGSNPCRRLSLLGIAHPVEGSLFQVQGVFRKTALTKGRFSEESRIVAFIFYFVKHELELQILIYALVKSNVITLELL